MQTPVLVLVHADELALRLAHGSYPEKSLTVQDHIKRRVSWHLRNAGKVYFTQYRNPKLPQYLESWKNNIVTVPFPSFFASQRECNSNETHLEHQARELEARIRQNERNPSIIEFWGWLKCACLSATVRHFVCSEGPLLKYSVPLSNPTAMRAMEVLRLSGGQFSCYENPVHKPGQAFVMNHEISF